MRILLSRAFLLKLVFDDFEFSATQPDSRMGR